MPQHRNPWFPGRCPSVNGVFPGADVMADTDRYDEAIAYQAHPHEGAYRSARHRPWARSTHAPALAAHPDIEFSGVWGRRREAAAELAAEHGTTAYDGVDALLAASDAVAVALPPDVQAPLATRAAAAGCHLLLDKPVATTVSGAREVVAAAARSGVASVVFCTLRFTPGVAEWIAGQAAVDGWFTGRAEWLGALFSPGVDSPYAASPWRGEKGGLWDVGPHALSVLLPVLGDATEVTAFTAPGTPSTSRCATPRALPVRRRSA